MSPMLEIQKMRRTRTGYTSPRWIGSWPGFHGCSHHEDDPNSSRSAGRMAPGSDALCDNCPGGRRKPLQPAVLLGTDWQLERRRAGTPMSGRGVRIRNTMAWASEEMAGAPILSQ
jgi:hypothetical protein